MLRLFFNKESPIVYALEAIGIVLVGWFCWQRSWMTWHVAHQILLGIFLVSYCLLRLCGTIRWYPRFYQGLPATSDQRLATQYLGIEGHFKKALVPTAYILFALGCWFNLTTWPYLLYIVDLLMLVIVHVNIILLYFHWKDRDPTPVNYYSRRDSYHTAKNDAALQQANKIILDKGGAAAV